MPRYFLEENHSECVVADVEAPDQMAAYLMAPQQLDEGEVPVEIAEEDAMQLWYGYRVYEAAEGAPRITEMAGDQWEVWERERRKHKLVARIGALDPEGW